MDAMRFIINPIAGSYDPMKHSMQHSLQHLIRFSFRHSRYFFLLLFSTLLSNPAFAGQTSEQKRTAKELRCLALNIYFEARGEKAEGQLAVGMVTMNRMKSRHYPGSVCGVVWQKRQFSWTHDGKSDRPTDMRAWDLAKKIAQVTYLGYSKLSARSRKALDLTKGALHFYAPSLASPYWAEVHSVTRVIGRHVFLTGRS
ncbi:MAG: cell wall hydrolase [Gammaproteobacteria bacterium]|nr:cell wall hydrolase [Gammaproteobacteria bacterium]